MSSFLLSLSSLAFAGTAVASSHDLIALLPPLFVVGSSVLFGGISCAPLTAGALLAQVTFLAGCSLFGLRFDFLVMAPSSKPPEKYHMSAPQHGVAIRDTYLLRGGRMGHLMDTGFIEEALLVPEFALAAQRLIADFPEALRRYKRHRGLGLLHRISAAESISIFNIKEWANAIKSRFTLGEERSVEILDRGVQINQGVGYLDDRTRMRVKTDHRHIGRTIEAVVKSTFQIDAGCMVFAKPAGEHARWERSPRMGI